MADPKAPAAPVTEAIQRTGARHVAVQRFRLDVASGPDKGQSFASKGGTLAVGTHASADVVLQDSAVSRFHCELRAGTDRVMLRDLGSLNGTTIDGVAVVEAPLRDGCTIGLGRTQLRFALGSEPVRVEVTGKNRFGLAVGRSAAMAQVFAALERTAATDVTILLDGETGTGKDIIAESIHAESNRRDGPFVVVDCGAVPPGLLESELFGHERGAFTGATGLREGAFEAASGGTLFLDEVGELSADLQPKLLRALEKREVKRLGAAKYARVDVRVVAATNRNLREEVNEGRFRPDLYYRLAVVQLHLPPLRERLDDVPLLLEEILKTMGASARPEAAQLRTPKFLGDLAHHRWAGNVRELRNYVERCLAFAEPPPLAGDARVDVSGEARSLVAEHLPLRAARELWNAALEKQYLEALLRRHDGNVTAAARDAGVARNHFYRLLWSHGLK